MVPARRMMGASTRGAMAMTESRVLQFALSGDKYCDQYGSMYWSVGLPDGREVMLRADRMEITDGVLTAWTYSRIDPADDDRVRRIPRDEPYATMAFAPGAWMTFYAASMLDGRPVAADHLAAPSKPSDWAAASR